MSSPFPIAEASIADLRAALDRGHLSSVELVRAYLQRIATYDHAGIRLNSVVALNPDALAEAAASDARRAAGASRGPLEGIAFTAKDSFMVKGMRVAAGSPAFEHLVASRDAFSVAALREAGCVFIGLTNMPPMANGGMQRGLYGRAESPYNADYLCSAWLSGSSNGSGTATAASFATFGLGEETWSSGRAPASCNALCAYTPSRGVISTRGNWPLVPTMDVVVPHTRTMADLCEVLDVLVRLDPDTSGDFWRLQPWLALPSPTTMRRTSFFAQHQAACAAVAQARASAAPRGPLAGVRLAAPRMFIGSDPEQGSGTGIGRVAGSRIEPRPSVLALWRAARADLEAAGAEVIETDFPVLTQYESDRPGAANIFTRGLVPADYFGIELWELSMWGWDQFLALNGQAGLERLAQVDAARVYPRHPEDTLQQVTSGLGVDITQYAHRARSEGIIDPFTGPQSALIRAGLEGLEQTRRVDFDDWLRAQGFAAAVFPTLTDVAPADTDKDPASAALAWRNGVWGPCSRPPLSDWSVTSRGVNTRSSCDRRPWCCLSNTALANAPRPDGQALSRRSGAGG
ncbi:MAG: amidase, partial [Betaproteobacteria bacterium]|nr:amidase [Betaproteobacteria bacterium]